MKWTDRNQGCVLVLAACAVFAVSQPALAQQEFDGETIRESGRIAFTEVPSQLGHTSNTCQRAMTLAGPIEFKTQTLHAGVTQAFGTQFVTWLRDGHSAIVTRISLAPDACPQVSDCACEPPLATVHLVPFLVDMRTGQEVMKLTQSFPDSDNLYADIGPVYSDAHSTAVQGYLVGLHDLHTNTTQVFKLNANAANPQPVAIPETAKAHGCALSPAGSQLACEVNAVNPSPHDMRFCLTDLNGAPCTFVQSGSEKLIMAAATWSPDARGFVYYSENNGQGRLMYYKSGAAPVALGPLQTDKFKWTPSFYCNDRRFSAKFTCKFYGALGSNIGSDMPAWSRNGDYVYYSAVNLAEEPPLHRVLVRIPLAHPDSIEILTPNFAGEPGHPAISPDGTSVIFTSPASAFDPRTEVYWVGVNEREPRRLTQLPPTFQAYALHWEH